MGNQQVKPIATSRAEFTRHLLADIEALDYMLAQGLFERGRQRIGAEQELSLVNHAGQPSMTGPELLLELPSLFTSEIGRFNIELNLDPHELDADAFRKMEAQLKQMLSLAEEKGRSLDAFPIMTGILPSLRPSHVEQQYMTPLVRYQILGEAIRKQRGADFEIHIQGADELIARLDSVMFEACNTSFQLHLQIHPNEFVEQYNWAQYISAPVMAVTANSPLLFGRELWHETRIALFQQSIDTRSSSNHLRNKRNRVGYGGHWLKDTPSAFYKDNITRFPALLAGDIEENPQEVLASGGIPKLKALRLHNGTIYSWNRPCYGISDTGFPHLRIENRYIPSGPSIADSIANLAFWVGLMKGMPQKYSMLSENVPFQVAKANFYRAARSGLNSMFNWDGQQITAVRLILDELVPIAETGLRKIGVHQSEINKYLGIIERRAILRQNGAVWTLRNFRNLARCYGKGVAVQEITQSIIAGQRSGMPIHEWDDIDCTKVYDLSEGKTTVDRVMKTDLFTVRIDEPVSLVKAVMKWKKIRHLPIEDNKGKLVGLITRSNLKSLPLDLSTLSAADIMITDLITAEHHTPLDEAAKTLKRHKIGCLPIVRNGHLTGLLTDTDFKKLYGANY